MARYAVLKSDMSGQKGQRDHYLIDAGNDARMTRLFDSRQSWDMAETKWPTELKSIAPLLLIAVICGIGFFAMGWQFNPMRLVLQGINGLVAGTGFDDMVAGQTVSPEKGQLLFGILMLSNLVAGLAIAIVVSRKVAVWLTFKFAPSIYIFDATDGNRSHLRTEILHEQFDRVANGEITAGSLAGGSKTDGKAVKRIRDIDKVVDDETSGLTQNG